ncbi:hypothetical protein F5Y10DRAFT_7278 [Nemania abortiva]|nr:hypothetical protein F5Y10DRAFT_7278 [Nemania abortiva]
MIIAKTLSLPLMVALLMFDSGIALRNFDGFRSLKPKTHAISRAIDTNEKAEKVGDGQFIGKHAHLTNDASPSVTPALGLVIPRGLLDGLNPEFKPPGDICGLANFIPCSSSISSSVSASVSNSVSNSAASVLSSITSGFSSSLLAARQSGFDEGQSKASEIAQSSYRAGISSTAEVSPCATETASCAAGNSHGTSHSLNLNAGQLAGIVVAVFIISSVSSILAMMFILWYRRQRAAITDKPLPSQIEAQTRPPRPVLGKLRSNIFPSAYGPAAIRSHQDRTRDTAPRLPSQNHEANPSVNRNSLTLPIGTNLTSHQVYPVSPLSDQLSNNSAQDSSPSLGLGLYGNRTQIASRSTTSGTPPIKLSLSRDETQDGPRRIQVVRMGVQEITPRRLFSSDIRDSTNERGEGTAGSAPISTMSTFLPPIVPLRFSSLNAYKGLPIQRPPGSHGNDGTFLHSTDDESPDHGPRFLQDQTGLQSPSHSSVISQDLTQFDPRGSGQEPVSRFSTSSAQLSLGYSASSTSPIPQFRHQQEEHPEISPLRPAPSSPLPLQAPTPRRPNLAANVGVSGPIYTL